MAPDREPVSATQLLWLERRHFQDGPRTFAVPQSALRFVVASADDSNRKVGLDEFEAYLAKTGDMQPIYYLIEKFLGDPGANEDSLREQALQTLASLPDLIAAAGLAKKGGRR